MVERLTSEEAFEALDVMDVAVIIADIINDGSWPTWVNPAFTRVFGYTVEDMLDGALARIVGDETDMAEIDRMYQEVRQGKTASVTTVGYCKDGATFWSTFTMSPVFAGGRVVRWVGVQHDVSEHVRRSQRDRRSYEIERRARVGLSLVGVVSDIMAEVDNPRVLESVARVLSGRLVPWAGFFDVDGGRLRPLVGVEAEDEDRSRRRERELASGHLDGDPVRDVLVSMEGMPGDVRLDAAYPRGSPAADLLTVIRPHRAAHPAAADYAMVVPVLGRRRTLCVLAALPRASDLREPESAEEIATILELVARRVGLAMENARLYAREHRLAETLQRAMLPEQVHVAGLDVWTYYAPAGEHAQVGGDWYDVVHVSDEAVGVVIGDVTGHDVGAAATMGQLRSIVRSYACELVDPATVLERVDKLVAGMRIAREATLAYAALTPLDGAWEVAYIRAGHLPPLLVRDGRVTALDGGGSLLIGIGQPVRETAHATVVPGDVLVFYTDGLVERRDRSMRDGVAALADLCGRLTATDAAGVGEELLAQLADAPEDDVAVVVVRVPDPSRADAGGDGPPQRRWQLPADTSSIARARHAVVTTCAAWDIPEARAAELVVSELVANAVVHGWGRVDLRLADLGADGLRIEVEDSNPAAPTELDGHDSRIGGFGLQIIGRLADWGWQPTERGKVVWAQIRPARRTT